MIADLKRDCLETYAASRPVGPGDCRRGLAGRLASAVLRVFSPLV
jgi:hypothetical protein